MLIIKSNIKDCATGFNISSDFTTALEEKTAQLIRDAVRRADANGRRTIMAKDL